MRNPPKPAGKQGWDQLQALYYYYYYYYFSFLVLLLLLQLHDFETITITITITGPSITITITYYITKKEKSGASIGRQMRSRVPKALVGLPKATPS